MVCSLAQVFTRSRRRVAAGLFLLPACAPLMALVFGNPFISALIRNDVRSARRLSCGRGWQRLSRSLPHLMYNYTDGETQVCLLSAIETLFTETCDHLHCCSIFVCLFILSSLGRTGIHFQLDFRCAQILFSCKVKPLREIF